MQLHCVERIAAHQLRKQHLERRRVREQIEARESSAGQKDRAHLTRLPLEGADISVDRGAVLLVDVPHRAGVGRGGQRLHLRGDVVPDRTLIGTAAGRIVAHGHIDGRHGAPPPAREMGAVRAFEHHVVVISPAALFDARHGNARFLFRGRQNRHVERPVLLGADQFLALHQQHRLVAQVPEDQLRHAPAVRYFAHLRQRRCQCFVQRQVRARRVPRCSHKGKHGHLLMDHRVAQGEAGYGVLNDLHGLLLLPGRTVYRRAIQSSRAECQFLSNRPASAVSSWRTPLKS